MQNNKIWYPKFYVERKLQVKKNVGVTKKLDRKLRSQYLGLAEVQQTMGKIPKEILLIRQTVSIEVQ